MLILFIMIWRVMEHLLARQDAAELNYTWWHAYLGCAGVEKACWIYNEDPLDTCGYNAGHKVLAARILMYQKVLDTKEEAVKILRANEYPNKRTRATMKKDFLEWAFCDGVPS